MITIQINSTKLNIRYQAKTLQKECRKESEALLKPGLQGYGLGSMVLDFCCSLVVIGYHSPRLCVLFSVVSLLTRYQSIQPGATNSFIPHFHCMLLKQHDKSHAILSIPPKSMNHPLCQCIPTVRVCAAFADFRQLS